MKCPIDETVLVMSERSGIEIDFCPQCRGVWLDRGELDKIVERGSDIPARDTDRDDRRFGSSDRGGHGGGGHGSGYSNDHGNRRRKGGWLGELFD